MIFHFDRPESEARVTDWHCCAPGHVWESDGSCFRCGAYEPTKVKSGHTPEIIRLRADLATREAALRVCDNALATIERRTLDDFPPYRVAPIEAFLPIIREARALVKQTTRAAPAEGGE